MKIYDKVRMKQVM